MSRWTAFVRSRHVMLLHFSNESEPPMLFERVHDTDTWFVDVFAGGQILPPTVIYQHLERLGVAPDEREPYTTPVPPASVWVRMLRNLTAHTRDVDAQRSYVWQCISYGLEQPQQEQYKKGAFLVLDGPSADGRHLRCIRIQVLACLHTLLNGLLSKTRLKPVSGVMLKQLHKAVHQSILARRSTTGPDLEDLTGGTHAPAASAIAPHAVTVTLAVYAPPPVALISPTQHCLACSG
eukprot:6175787-Pleurochrysis_carterae.AAC.1